MNVAEFIRFIDEHDLNYSITDDYICVFFYDSYPDVSYRLKFYWDFGTVSGFSDDRKQIFETVRKFESIELINEFLVINGEFMYRVYQFHIDDRYSNQGKMIKSMFIEACEACSKNYSEEKRIEIDTYMKILHRVFGYEMELLEKYNDLIEEAVGYGAVR